MNGTELSNLVDAMGWGLVHSVWQCTVVAGALAVLLGVTRKASASARYTMAYVALALCAALPAVTVQRHLAQADGEVHMRPATAQLDREPVILPNRVAPAAATTETPPLPWINPASAMRGLVMAWAAGVAMAGVWHIAGYVRVSRLRRRGARPLPEAWMNVVRGLADRMGVRRPLCVRLAAGIESPVVVGMLKPVILVPASMLTGLPAGQVEAILAHELAHLRRWDDVANAIQIAIETLMFYHPAMWWVSRVIRREREHCCDDMAADECGSAVVYAEALTALESQRGHPKLALGVAGGGERLIDRIHRVLGRPHRAGARKWSVANSVAAVACGVLPLTVAGACGGNGARTATATAAARPATQTLEPSSEATTETDASALREAANLRQVQEERIGAPDGHAAPPPRGARPAKVAMAPAKPAVPARPAAPPPPPKLWGTGEPPRMLRLQPTTVPTKLFAMRTSGRARVVQVVIDAKGAMTLDGKPATWDDIERRVREIPQDEQRRAVVRVGVASPDVTVGRLDEAQLKAHGLVDKYGLSHVSYVGVQPMNAVPATQPAAEMDRVEVIRGIAKMHEERARWDNEQARSEFEADRARTIEAAKAAEVARSAEIRARIAEEQARRAEDQARRAGEQGRRMAEMFKGDAGRADDAERAARSLRANAEGLESRLVELRARGFGENHPDVVKAKAMLKSMQDAVAADGARKPRTGEYYVSGDVARPGVYVLSPTSRGITVKQALVSAGLALDGAKEKYVSVLRREKDGERFVMRGVPLGKLLNADIPDTTVEAGDVVTVTEGAKPNGPATSPATWPTAQASASTAVFATRGVFRLEQRAEATGPVSTKNGAFTFEKRAEFEVVTPKLTTRAAPTLTTRATSTLTTEPVSVEPIGIEVPVLKF